MTLIIDENIANANLVLKFMGALDREDYLLCRAIKDKLKLTIADNQEIDDLKYLYTVVTVK